IPSKFIYVIWAEGQRGEFLSSLVVPLVRFMTDNRGSERLKAKGRMQKESRRTWFLPFAFCFLPLLTKFVQISETQPIQHPGANHAHRRWLRSCRFSA